MKTNRKYAFIIVLSLSSIYLIGNNTIKADEKSDKSSLKISKGYKVLLEYTAKLENDSIVDTTVGNEPLTYIHGISKLMPGLQKELEGMKIGETKQIIVKPEDAYGKVETKGFIEVKKSQVPIEKLKLGSQLETKDEAGRVVYSIVKEIREKTVLLDFNHPLAGKTMYFDVKVIDIEN